MKIKVVDLCSTFSIKDNPFIEIDLNNIKDLYNTYPISLPYSSSIVAINNNGTLSTNYNYSNYNTNASLNINSNLIDVSQYLRTSTEQENVIGSNRYENICNYISEYIIKNGFNDDIKDSDYYKYSTLLGNQVKDRYNNIDDNLKKTIFFKRDYILKHKYDIRKLFIEEWFKSYFLDKSKYLANRDITFYFRMNNFIRSNIRVPLIDDHNYICNDIYLNIKADSYIDLYTFLLIGYDYNLHENFLPMNFSLCTFINNDNEVELILNSFNSSIILFEKDKYKSLSYINFNEKDNIEDELNYYYPSDGIRFEKMIRLNNFKYVE